MCKATESFSNSQRIYTLFHVILHFYGCKRTQNCSNFAQLYPICAGEGKIF